MSVLRSFLKLNNHGLTSIASKDGLLICRFQGICRWIGWKLVHISLLNVKRLCLFRWSTDAGANPFEWDWTAWLHRQFWIGLFAGTVLWTFSLEERVCSSNAQRPPTRGTCEDHSIKSTIELLRQRPVICPTRNTHILLREFSKTLEVAEVFSNLTWAYTHYYRCVFQCSYSISMLERKLYSTRYSGERQLLRRTWVCWSVHWKPLRAQEWPWLDTKANTKATSRSQESYSAGSSSFSCSTGPAPEHCTMSRYTPACSQTASISPAWGTYRTAQRLTMAAEPPSITQAAAVGTLTTLAWWSVSTM